MAAVKKSISLPDSLYKLAEQASKDEHYATFSDYIQAVIKDDLARRRTAPMTLHDDKPPITYPRRKRSIPKEREN